MSDLVLGVDPAALELEWSITIPGPWRPEAKRSQPLGKGGWTRVDTDEVKQFKAYVRLAVAQGRLPDMPWAEPLAMTIIWTRPKPSSYPKGVNWPWKRPDLNNLTKALEDAMTKVIYEDDSMICHQDLTKQFGDDWSVTVTIRRLEPDWPYRKVPQPACGAERGNRR